MRGSKASTEEELSVVEPISRLALDKKLVGTLLDKLIEPTNKNSQTRQPVYRDRRHAIAWFICYIETEIERLEDEFVNGMKYFDYELRREIENKWLKFSFRLRTHGLDGFTEYSIEINKEGSYFACFE